MSILREYIITLHSFEDLESFYNDMETVGGNLYIPDRAVNTTNRRPLSRNTHYMLSDEEAELIKNDSRVADVTLSLKEAGLHINCSYVDTSDLWSKGPNIATGYKNWGLLRIREGQNRPNWGSDGERFASGTFNVPANGENVDVVIVDGFIDPAHPEFAINADGTGGTRINQFNWLTYNETITGNPNNTYVYGPYRGPSLTTAAQTNNNHGTHVAGIATGNTQGWARKSNIYNICPYGYDLSNVAAGISGENIIDFIRLWHTNKPVNPATEMKNPTVINLSIAAGVNVNLNNITQVVYRGTTYNGPFTQSDFINWSPNIYYSNNPSSIFVLQPYAPLESDLADAITDGIIVVGAAGNAFDKITRDTSDIDYNNRIVTTSGTLYINRGTFTAAPNVICVGAANDSVIEQKAEFSNTGPRVDLYAPGVNIVGPTNSASGSGIIADSRNTLYGVRKGSGTSYAAPQATGVIALLLDQNPNATPSYIKQYLNQTAASGVLTVNSNGGGVSDLTSLQNGNNNYLTAQYSNLAVTLTIDSPFLIKKGVEITPFQPVSITGELGDVLYETTTPLPYDLYYDPVIGYLAGSCQTATTIVTSFQVSDSVTTVISEPLTIVAYDNVSSSVVTPVINATFSEFVFPTLLIFGVGGYGTYTFSINPGLPAGLEFDTESSLIFGTPYELVYQAAYTVTVTDFLGQSSSQVIQLSVLPSDFDLTSSVSSATLTVDLPIIPIYPVSVTSAYGNISFSISPPLPSGLVFDEDTAAISGTPLVASSTTTYTITATDEFQRSLSETIQINTVNLITSYSFTEGVYTNITLAQYSQNINFDFISGTLPPGISIVDRQYLVGIPEYVSTTTTYKFVLRTSLGTDFVFDRLFTTTVSGSDNIIWATPAGHLQLGISNELYAINNQWVDFLFSASVPESPADTRIKYFIPENGGTLPPGLQLTYDGRLFGFVRDQLTFDGEAIEDGSYDGSAYDFAGYDSGTEVVDTDSIGIPKIYQFKVAATDGVTQSIRNFKIMVVSPSMIIDPDSVNFEFDYNILQTNTNYLPPLQFINESDLGTIRAENNDNIDISAYDPYPSIGTVEYTLSIDSSLPDFLSLDAKTGYIYGYIPYQPAYTRYYNFDIDATRRISTGLAVTTTNSFSLAIKGKVESTIEWISDTNLGTIVSGETSELAVIAKNINTDYSVKYRITTGELPPGLIMNSDGTISGKVDYTADADTYPFSVIASDVYGLSAIERDFELTVEHYGDKEYTEIYCKPFMSLQKRNTFNSIMSDEFVFPPNLMYRPIDPNFGVQHEIKLVLEFGIEKLNLADYLPALRENFYRRRFFFGNIKVAIAKDATDKHLYDVVYVEVYDNLINDNNISVSPVIHDTSNTYFPASITNMKRQLRRIVLDDFSVIGVNEYNMPKYMRTPQESDYKPIGYLRTIPLCFTLPNNGKKIVSRIKIKNIDFKQFDFDVDRIIVKESLDNSTDKYLLLERTSITDSLETDNYLFGPDNVRLD